MNALVHDFTKPTRLPADWHQRLTNWFRTAFTLANKAWVKELPVPLEACLYDVDVYFAHQALSRLPEGFFAYRVMLAGERLPTYFAMPRSLMVGLVGALVGEKSEVTDRELTPVEENLMEYFLTRHWLEFFRQTWPSPAPIAWTLQSIEANPQCSRVFAPADVLVTLHWQIKGPWGETGGSWFFPKKALLEELGGVDPMAPPTLSEAQVSVRRQALVSELPISMEVVLGTAELKLSQLSRLQVGDVVILDQREGVGATASSSGRQLFRGQVGRVGSLKAFRIDSAVER